MARGAIDRLLDERHSLLVGSVADLLRADAWIVEVEVSFSIFGERGSIDILAYHPDTRTLLIIEVKTELTSIEETIRRNDVKVRLGVQIATERFGWPLGRAAPDRLLGRPRDRRQTDGESPVTIARLSVAYPVRGRQIRRWLAPAGRTAAGLLFLPISNPSGTGRRRQAGISCRVSAPDC